MGLTPVHEIDSGQPRHPISDYPLVTVVVLCRNERAHIEGCLDSLLQSTYPADRIEILVVDGMSHDGTRMVVESYTAQNPCVRLLDNPRLITPCAMNVGVTSARGEVIAIIGAHTSYDRDYLSECVRHLKEYEADVVGAVAEYVPRRATAVGRAIVVALSHPFGAGANAAYKIGASEPTWVDTVSSALYRRSVFQRVGLFNERLTFSQDYEFSVRIRRAGGRVLLVPSAVIRYHARSSFVAFSKHNYRNGLWVVLPFLYSDVLPVTWRHLVPLLFVLVLGGTLALSLVGVSAGGLVFLVVSVVYLVMASISALQVARRERDARFVALLPVIFASLHIAYGVGSLVGICRVMGAIVARGWGRVVEGA